MAPLTLLVGENSTGKTSFLAILRALWDVAVHEVVPDFRREPYDLGAFSEIVYNDSSRSEQTDAFQAGFKDSDWSDFGEVMSFRFTFQDVVGVAYPVLRYASVGNTSFEVVGRAEQTVETQLAIDDRSWKVDIHSGRFSSSHERLPPIEFAMYSALRMVESNGSPISLRETAEQYEDQSLSEKDMDIIVNSQSRLRNWQFDRGRLLTSDSAALFAGAPVRSKPRRTYDPSRPITDPEGEYVPAYLSMLFRRDPSAWRKLRDQLEQFGAESGLFDEIVVESFGMTDATPFQIQIRKSGGKLKGKRRNLIDVGYGVSQALPIITELLRPGAASMFLLQQPEVHLHPSAQAALGSLFCSIAGSDRQLVVETHSDYIIDRVRMDVRDKETDLKPEDVSILYFERGESDVKIHSIRLDADGNVLDAPDSYGQFFMEETRRSIGL